MAQRIELSAGDACYSRVTSVVSIQDGQTTRANVKVVVRIRPENRAERSGNYGKSVQVLDEQVLVFDPKEAGTPDFYHGKKRRGRDITKKKAKDVKFAFDQVFDSNCSNRDVYNNTTRCVLKGLLEGYNCSVFAYGATGAGKTFTMLGNLENPGVVFFTMMDLYTHINEIKEDKTCEVAISYMEVYNEQIRDLLMPGAYLPIREDPNKGAVVTGLSLHKPVTAEELMHMLAFGNQNRTQHPTDANKESSRSHAVFQVFVRQKDRTANISADVRVAKMSLIDLAGSERATVTTNRGARFREGANINRSLLALGNCINALADGKAKGYVPYRNSKLTRLLKDSLGGNCQTVMIAAISPSNMTYEDTHNTLKYANRAKNIKANLKRNMLSVDFHVSKYAKICDELRVEVTELRLKLKQYEEEGVLSMNKQSVLPSSRQLEIERVQGEVYRVYLDRTGIRKELMELEGSERDVMFRIHSRKRSLARINALYTDPSESDKVTSRLERSIAAAVKRLGGIKSRKEGIVRRMCDNSDWLAKVECSVQGLGKTGEVPQVLVSCIRASNVEVELRDTKRQVKFLKKICRAQEREAQSSEKLISTLLHTVKRQYYLLMAHGLATSDVTSEFEGVRQAVSGEKEVVWADQNVSCDPSSHDMPDAVEGCAEFNINHLLDFPVLLSGCMTPQTPHGRQLVQYASTPMTCGKTPLSVSKHPTESQPPVPVTPSGAVVTTSQTLQVPTPKVNNYINVVGRLGQESLDTSTLRQPPVTSQQTGPSQCPVSLGLGPSQCPVSVGLGPSLSAPGLLPGSGHTGKSAIQFGSQTVTIDPSISVLVNNPGQMSSHLHILGDNGPTTHRGQNNPVSTENVKNHPPGTYSVQNHPPGTYSVQNHPPGTYSVQIHPTGTYRIENQLPGTQSDQNPPPGTYSDHNHAPGTFNVKNHPPGTRVTRTPSYSMKQTGSMSGVSQRFEINDTFTMEGIYPLQASPTAPEGEPVVNGTTNSSAATPQQVSTSVANHPSVQRPELLGPTAGPECPTAVSQPAVNTATVTKAKPSVITQEKVPDPVNKNVSRVIEFTTNSNTGPKSFAEAVKSPASVFRQNRMAFSPRSPLMARENLPEFTPTGNINQLPSGDIRRMTFAAHDGPRHQLFPTQSRPAETGGPVRRQTISATEAKRMESLHRMGLPSVSERRLGGLGPTRQPRDHHGGSAPGQNQPRYMQLTKAASRRHQNHRRSPINEHVNDENRKPHNGAQRVVIEDTKRLKSHHSLARSKSFAKQQPRFNVY